MKSIILQSGFTILILLMGTCGLSQNYDLIVTTKGDSIVCRIDSITGSHLYFQMKSQHSWVHTQLEQADVSMYKRNAIYWKQYVFKEGTSTIESLKKGVPASIRDVQRNSVYVGIFSIGYSRMIPGDNVGFTVSGGLSFLPIAFEEDDLGFIFETTLLTYGTVHYFEPGLLLFYDTNNDWPIPLVRIGYRYQNPEGFLIRAGLLTGYLDGFGVVPAISIGYSF